jgi:hypothetical protein
MGIRGEGLSQTLSDARAVSLGAYAPLASDSRDFSLNPAGLSGVRDWETAFSTYTIPTSADAGFVFHGLTLAKRIGDFTAAFQYSPGTVIRFVVPPTLIIGHSANPVTNDQTIEYAEPFALGLSYRLNDQIVVALGGRNRRETVDDTRYEIVLGDTVAIPVIYQTTSEARSWNVDAALAWKPSQAISVSLLGRNVIVSLGSDLPASIDSLSLSADAIGELGVAVRPGRRIALAAAVTTDVTGGAGVEWTPGLGMAFRAGLYFDESAAPFVNAVAVGAGWSYEFVEVGAAYLRFLDQTGRRGSTEGTSFDPSGITMIDFNPYSSDRIVISVKAMFGQIRESLARIEGVKISGAVYPASAATFAVRPVGMAQIRNVSDRVIQAKASFFVERYMDEPTETMPVTLQPGQVVDVPLTAVFNEQVRRVSSQSLRDATVAVMATPAGPQDDSFQTRILIQGRNAWDGDVLSLRYFVTPDDPSVIKYTRDVLVQSRDSLAVVNRSLEQFVKARLLIDTFAGGLTYVGDPRQSADYVQYPAETLSLRTGDCDDMTVCFASLLTSIGVSVAFVDVIPPGQPDQGHIYLLYDTGVEPRYGSSIASNPKRFVVRSGREGKVTAWIPIETTVIADGFQEAWDRGAEEYYEDVEVGLGLLKGWVRIVDVY